MFVSSKENQAVICEEEMSNHGTASDYSDASQVSMNDMVIQGSREAMGAQNKEIRGERVTLP